MTPAIVRKEIRIHASADCVWPYIGTEEGLRQWWGTTISLEAKVGGYCEERSQMQGISYLLRGEVTAYAPPHHLALILRNMDQGASWPTLTTLHITLQDEGEETLVTLVHRAFGPGTEPRCQRDDHVTSPVAETTNTITTNRLMQGLWQEGQGPYSSLPLHKELTWTSHPLRAGHISKSVERHNWLETQRVAWITRWMRLIALSTEKAI